jgi:hypothetical protein
LGDHFVDRRLAECSRDFGGNSAERVKVENERATWRRQRFGALGDLDIDPQAAAAPAERVRAWLAHVRALASDGRQLARGEHFWWIVWRAICAGVFVFWW